MRVQHRLASGVRHAGVRFGSRLRARRRPVRIRPPPFARRRKPRPSRLSWRTRSSPRATREMHPGPQRQDPEHCRSSHKLPVVALPCSTQLEPTTGLLRGATPPSTARLNRTDGADHGWSATRSGRRRSTVDGDGDAAAVGTERRSGTRAPTTRAGCGGWRGPTREPAGLRSRYERGRDGRHRVCPGRGRSLRRSQGGDRI